MRTFWVIGVLVFVVLISSAVSFASAKAVRNPRAPASVVKQLNQFISDQIDADEAEHCTWETEDEMKCRESEYRQARQFRYGDLNADGRKDIVVRYVLQGRCCGNNSRSYLAVFLNTVSGYKLVISREIGRRGVRSTSLLNINKAIIRLTTNEYSAKDPMCCPSIKGTTSYIFKDDELVEQSPTGGQYDECE